MKLGIISLFQSAKGTLSVIVLACATTAVFMAKIDGASYAAIVATVSSIFHLSRAISDNRQPTAADLPPKGSI